jgi:predicted RNase H-like HicB family nuclease
MDYQFSTVITKEGDGYVGTCPELNITSRGEDVESTQANLRAAIELHLVTWGSPSDEYSQAGFTVEQLLDLL